MRIGITGGICSGKTTICKQLEEYYPVFYSDTEAKYIANNDVSVIERIIGIFGVMAYMGGEYNTSFISKEVFRYPEKMKLLNDIFRSKVRESFEEFCIDKDIVIFESALIYEHNIDYLDHIINVYCDIETVKSRIKNRDGRSDSEINNILKSQMHPDEKRDIAEINVESFPETLGYIKSLL